MIINLYNTEIISGKYGTENININVLNKIINYKNFIVNNTFFEIDPVYGKKKYLFIILKNNKKYKIKENDICEFINNKNCIKTNIQNIKIKENDINFIKTNIQNIEINKYNYILSTNVKDENNILEFILYHLMIGFDKIFIIDHLSKEPVKDIINKLPDKYKNKIEIFRFNRNGPYKLYFLNDIIIPYMKKNCNKYFIHLDGDEYINLNNNFNTIDELMRYYKYPEILCLNWLLFGSNNKENNDNKYKCLIPTYTKCENTIHEHFKIIISSKLNNYNYINPHMILIKDNNTIYTDINNNKHILNSTKYEHIYNLFRSTYTNKNIKKIKTFINHYTIQSKQDYLKRKVKRYRDDKNENRENSNEIFKIYNDIEYNNLLPYYNKIKLLIKYEKLNFIILRHVNNKLTDTYWQYCYDCIRKFYNNKIIIIDDHSDTKFLTINKKLINTKILNSTFKGRGELLPYYYYLKNNFSEKIVMLHDSMFINEKINFENIKGYNNFTRLFSFPNAAYKIDLHFFKEYCNIINKGNIILQYHEENLNKLIGCFGVCYIIDYKFLKHIENKYKISKLINIINTRAKRKTLERFFSCLFEYENNLLKQITLPDLNGSIFKMITLLKQNKQVKIEKIFSGR
jgi:hypothetical protein